MKKSLPIAGQSSTGQKFHSRYRVSDKSVSTSNLRETCVQVEYAYLSDDAFTISF